MRLRLSLSYAGAAHRSCCVVADSNACRPSPPSRSVPAGHSLPAALCPQAICFQPRHLPHAHLSPTHRAAPAPVRQWTPLAGTQLSLEGRWTQPARSSGGWRRAPALRAACAVRCASRWVRSGCWAWQEWLQVRLVQVLSRHPNLTDLLACWACTHFEAWLSCASPSLQATPCRPAWRPTNCWPRSGLPW